MTEDGKAYVVELNGRITGQMHGVFKSHNILGTAMPDNKVWAVTCSKVPRDMSLSDYSDRLDIAGIGYSPKTKTGVAVSSHGVRKVGTHSDMSVNQLFHIADTREEFSEQVRRLQALF